MWPVAYTVYVSTQYSQRFNFTHFIQAQGKGQPRGWPFPCNVS
jgi:hypothetical protein